MKDKFISMTNHKNALKDISVNPSRIGLDDVVLLATEVKLFDSDGRLIGEPDVFAYDLRKHWILGEYKCNSVNGNDKKAEHQLHRNYAFLLNKGVLSSASLYFIYGNMFVEQKK